MGIAGAGVSALARVYLARGDSVSGCDLLASATTEGLRAEGAVIEVGHDPAHVAGQELVVHSGAVRADEPELLAARQRTLVLSRAEALAQLIAGSESIAVAGSHGKTTITYMVGHVLAAAGWDPTVLVGDRASSRVGASPWLVAEADESDGSLVLHHPLHAVVSNVELDHTLHFDSVQQIEAEVSVFLAGMRPGGVAVLCADDPRVSRLAAAGRRVTYGFAEGADYRCSPERPFLISGLGRGLGSIGLAVPGRHNIQNACGAAALCLELGIDFVTVAGALARYPGAHRRLERIGTWRGATVYDDYGHHPTEIRATVAAARELGHRRVVLGFQNHHYWRWAALERDFHGALAEADVAVVAEIYAPGEANPWGATAATVETAVPGARFARDLGEMRVRLEEVVEPGDLVLLMSAGGEIRRLGDELAKSG